MLVSTMLLAMVRSLIDHGAPKWHIRDSDSVVKTEKKVQWVVVGAFSMIQEESKKKRSKRRDVNEEI